MNDAIWIAGVTGIIGVGLILLLTTLILDEQRITALEQQPCAPASVEVVP